MTLRREPKPFPWQCPRCLKGEVWPTPTEYTTRVKHDGRLHEVTLPGLLVPKCSACSELVLSNDTDEQISRALRDKLGLLQPEEIRRKREKLGLTQKTLAERIGVAPETISRWESGLLIQSRAMTTLLSIFFDFPDVRVALEAGVGSLDSTGSLSGWTAITKFAPLTPNNVFANPITWFPTMIDVPTPLTAMFGVPVVLPELIVVEGDSLATVASEVSTSTSSRLAA
ncbi:MAG: type II TA system antitoxin MqsA family protein [Planctomycetota bacterium]